MSQRPPQPPPTGTSGSAPLSVQSILNPSTDQSPERGERPRSPSGASRPGGGRRGSAPPRPILGGTSTLPIHPQQQLQLNQPLPPIRPEPPSSSSPTTSFSPRERYGQPVQPLSSYGGYRESGPPMRPGDDRGPPPRRTLPPPHYGPMIPEEPPNMQQGPPPGGNFQYMTIDSASGPMQIQVDVHAASRSADEKRKRNAGASARFRQRRKERETQSTREIDDLRQEIRELQEDSDFYRQERDILLPLVYERDDRERLLPRPISPRRLRPARQAGSAASPSSYSASYVRGSPAYEERGDRSSSERHTRRRLTQEYPQGTIQPPPPPPPSSSGYGGYPPQSQPQQYRLREDPSRMSYDARRDPRETGGPLPPPPPGPGPVPYGTLPPPQPRPREHDPREQPPQPPDPYRRDWPGAPPPPPQQPPDRHGRHR